MCKKMKNRYFFLFTIISILSYQSVFAQKEIAPHWTRDLIIYEINPYAFTSPNGAGDGSGSGNFKSLEAKLPYLEELGINGIWLAGYCNATNHFCGIKSVYACIRPDEFDPDLGTGEEFKSMIDEAHRRGIKVFLDVITHGVLNESPLILEHPDWFKGESWRMKDFDYDNKEFREWWTDVWVNYSLKYGVDGYRLDGPNGFESSSKVLGIWDEIFNQCLAQGDTILIWPETCRYHFSQWDIRTDKSNIMREFDSVPRYRCHQISCHDHGMEKSKGNHYAVQGSRGKFIYKLFGFNIPIFMSGEEFDADQVSLPDQEKNLFGGGGEGYWLYGSWIQWEQLKKDKHLDMLNDVKKIIRIKKENSDLIHYDRSQTNIVSLTTYPRLGKIPYARFIPGQKAILIITNPSDKEQAKNLNCTIEFPLSAVKMDDYDLFYVTDLWNDSTSVVSKEELLEFEINVPADYQKEGGFRILKIEPKK